MELPFRLVSEIDVQHLVCVASPAVSGVCGLAYCVSVDAVRPLQVQSDRQVYHQQLPPVPAPPLCPARRLLTWRQIPFSAVVPDVTGSRMPHKSESATQSLPATLCSL